VVEADSETDGETGKTPVAENLATTRPITGFHQDELGDWVAELGCGHNQHVRHRPPFQVRQWVVDPAGRDARLGTPLPCPLCDRAELPDDLRWVRSTPTWDDGSMPAGLRRAHRVAAGTWGRITVHAGRLRFRAATHPATEVDLDTGATQPIPPEIDHDVTPLGTASFSVDFFAVDRPIPDPAPAPVDTDAGDASGDPACWAGLLCPECGAVTSDGYHRPGCPAAPA